MIKGVVSQPLQLVREEGRKIEKGGERGTEKEREREIVVPTKSN